MQELNLFLNNIHHRSISYNKCFFSDVFKTAWCRERKIARSLREMTNKELDTYLRHFYPEAGTKDGKPYKGASLLRI